MLSFRLIIVAVCAFLLSFFSQNVFASDNGQVKIELQDPVAVGMGGAFVGEADRPSAVYYNPAGIVQMDTIEASAGLTWIQPQMKFESATANNGATSEMKEDNYLFPSIFVTIPIIKNKLYIGLGESSDFAGGNDWEATGFSQYSTIKDSLTDKDYRIALAYKINDQWSVGIASVDDESQTEHDVAINQGGGSSNNGNALFKANDNSWGFDVSTMYKLNAQNQFGLNYKSPIQHDYDGTIYLSGMDVPGLGSLFGSSSTFSTEATEKFTLPQSVTLGYDFKPTNKWTFNFDLEWTDWSQYKQQIIDYPNLNPSQAGALSSGVPQARDWMSAWSESIGVQYAVTDKFRLRTGYEHHQSFVPQANFDTDYPDLSSNSAAFGLGYDITSKLTIDIAYVASFDDSRKVTTTIGSPNLNGQYSGFVNIGTMMLTYKF